MYSNELPKCEECGKQSLFVEPVLGKNLCDHCFVTNYDACRACNVWIPSRDIQRVRIKLDPPKGFDQYDYRGVCAQCFASKSYEAIFGVAET